MAAVSHVSLISGGSTATKTNELTRRSVEFERQPLACFAGLKSGDKEHLLKSRTTITRQHRSQSRPSVTRAAKKGFGAVTKAPEAPLKRAEIPLNLEVTETAGENCTVKSVPIQSSVTR